MKGPLGRDYGAPYLLLHRGDFHSVLGETVRPETIKVGNRLVGMNEKANHVELSYEDEVYVFVNFSL